MRTELAKTNDYTTETFEVHSWFFSGFYVDIITKPDEREAYLWHDALYGKKEFIYGAGVRVEDEETFMQRVKRSLDNEMYKFIREKTTFEENYQDIEHWDEK